MGIANQTAIYAIIAIGMTMVIITGRNRSCRWVRWSRLASVSSALMIRDWGQADSMPA